MLPLFSCSTDRDLPNTSSGRPMLFVIAGQSNAEGAVFLSGLEKLQRTIPQNQGELSTEQRFLARKAVAESLGVFCEVDFDSFDPNNSWVPFSFSTADAVIDNLMVSTIDWRSIHKGYQHERAKIITANYHHAEVNILDANGMIVDNEACTHAPTLTTRTGPELVRYTDENIVPLGPGFGTETTPPYMSFGPELGFGLRVAQSIDNPVLLKVTMGGSSLNDSWRISGPLYQRLIQETLNAMEQNNLELGGFVWFQGFNDQFESVYCEPLAPLYEENLNRFLFNVRKDLNAPNLPVVIVESRNGEQLNLIQQAQNCVVTADENAALAVSKDLSDCFHYGSGSQIIIGERAANKMLRLLGAE